MNNLESLRKKLDLHSSWPMNYMFKFIVPAQMDKIARVEALFSNEAIITRNESKNGKFVSISARQRMESSDQIIRVYEKASGIDKILAL
ncbi:MAG: DUF493 family protein [Bacteroidota bacterium]